MRFLAVGLAAAIAIAGLSPVVAHAQAYGAPAAQKPPEPRPSGKDKKAAAASAAVDAKSKAKGMAEAPALIQQTGNTCTVADANYMGASKAKDDKGKEVTTNVYEVACSEGMGYLVLAKEGAAPDAYNCLKMATNAAKSGGKLVCALPGNADLNKPMQDLVTKAGEKCTVNKSRWIGTVSESKVDQYEVACSEGGAYIVVAPQPGSTKSLVAESCLIASRAGVACEYQPKETIVAQIKAMAAPANRTACEVNDATYVGESTANKHVFYELGCTDGKSGYILETDAAGKYVNTIDCARASAFAGGCKLTTVAAAGETSDTATYAKLAKDIGYDCAVTSYRSLGMESTTNREIVELACSNHPGGAVAFLPTAKGQSGEYINCARAEARGLKCSVNTPESSYAAITAQLKANGKDCPVNGMRGMGFTAANEDFVEVTCSTGGGLVIKYAPGPDKISDVLACVQAKGVGGGCKLQQK
jgi:hypothetical protein